MTVRRASDGGAVGGGSFISGRPVYFGNGIGHQQLRRKPRTAEGWWNNFCLSRGGHKRLHGQRSRQAHPVMRPLPGVFGRRYPQTENVTKSANRKNRRPAQNQEVAP